MAQDLNKFFVIGHITKDVGSDERSYGTIGNGVTKAVISIANNSAKKQGEKWVEETSFFDIQLFGKQAENLKQYLKKGTQIMAECRLKQDRWEKDGQKRSAISIIADRIQLLGGKKDGSDTSSSDGNSNGSQQQSFEPADGFPEDIPF